FILFTGDPKAFSEFLQQAYRDDIAQLNQAWQSDYGSFEQIPLPSGQWLSGQQRQDYEQFLSRQPIEQLRLTGPEYAWQSWQQQQGLSSSPMPVAALEYDYVQRNSGRLRWTFTIRNYVNVFDELILE